MARPETLADGSVNLMTRHCTIPGILGFFRVSFHHHPTILRKCRLACENTYFLLLVFLLCAFACSGININQCVRREF